jgi:hypothetical protein
MDFLPPSLFSARYEKLREYWHSLSGEGIECIIVGCVCLGCCHQSVAVVVLTLLIPKIYELLLLLLLSLLPTSVCQHRAAGHKLCILKFKSFAPCCTEKPCQRKKPRTAHATLVPKYWQARDVSVSLRPWSHTFQFVGDLLSNASSLRRADSLKMESQQQCRTLVVSNCNRAFVLALVRLESKKRLVVPE